MKQGVLPAILLVALLGFAGCLGAVEPEVVEEVEDPVSLETPLLNWQTPVETIALDGTPIVLQVSYQGDGWDLTPSIITPEFKQVNAYGWSKTTSGFALEFLPAMLGNYTVSIGIEPTEPESIAPKVATISHTIQVMPPEELAPVLSAPVREVLEEPNLLWFEGTLTHDDIDTCTMGYSVSDGSSGSIVVKADGTWKVLLDFTEIETTMTITTSATCGQFESLSDTTGTLVILEGGGADADGDSIPDSSDRCPDGIGEADGWKSNANSDKDDDGCRDNDEDDDDDNDGVLDLHDRCPDSLGWISTPDADFDSDGCHDTDEDEDDDNDDVLDADDACPYGRVGWGSTLYTDWDGDGCLDLDEDEDDDNDGALDGDDLCPKGF